jgi:hypothetical protein
MSQLEPADLASDRPREGSLLERNDRAKGLRNGVEQRLACEI